MYARNPCTAPWYQGGPNVLRRATRIEVLCIIDIDLDVTEVPIKVSHQLQTAELTCICLTREVKGTSN